MNTIRGLENLPGERSRSVVTDGTFDGVHLGHHALLHRTVELAEAHGVLSCVVTYDPPPSQFFSDDSRADRLTTLEEKLNAFCSAGLDLCAVLRFDRALSQLDARQFARQVFCEGLGVVAVVAGAGHTFGAGGRGTLATLQRIGAEMEFAVEVVPDASHGGERVSSSGIRDALRKGDVAKAAAMLGRPYVVCATVVPGKGVGVGLGYPTANLPVEDRKLLPADSVYAGHACAGGARYPAVAHVGGSPTFDEAKRLVEVHVPDRDVELNGREVCFEMLERIRAPIRFASHEQLKMQIGADVEQARRTLQRWNAGAAAFTPETE